MGTYFIVGSNFQKLINSRMEQRRLTKEKQIFNYRPKKSFWAVNFSGWILMCFINILFQTGFFTENFEAITYSGLIGFTGIVWTLLIRYLLLKVDLINKKWAIIIPVVFVLVIVTSLIAVFMFSELIVFLLREEAWTWADFIGNWFNFSLIILVWTLIYLSFLFFKKQQGLIEQKYDLLLQLKSAELNNLRKQLSPHFLFNSINNIRSLILINPEEARTALLNVSDLLRYALNYQKKELVSVEEEMEVVMAYIDLNKIHLKDMVRFETTVEEKLNGMMIPPMSIQLLVENAIKHGELIRGGEVKVSVSSNGNTRVIEVVNSGELLLSEITKGIGLQNLKQRLASKFEENATFSIKEKDNQVIAQIKIEE